MNVDFASSKLSSLAIGFKPGCGSYTKEEMNSYFNSNFIVVLRYKIPFSLRFGKSAPIHRSSDQMLGSRFEFANDLESIERVAPFVLDYGNDYHTTISRHNHFCGE